MWLKDSSIGRKFIMSLTGLALVLFLIFHGCMNLAVVFSEEAYNTICHLLGANWYALIGTLGLALLVVLHFCYAIYLTIQNRAARGNDRYAVTGKKEGVEWESENMLVLGTIVIGFLVLHLYNFWFRRALVPSPSRCLVCIAYLGLEQPRLDEAHQSDRCHHRYVGCTAVRNRCFVLPRRWHRNALRCLMIYDYGKERRDIRCC